MSLHAAGIQAVSRPTFDAQEQRVLALKRAYQRELNRKPGTLQKALIEAAAVMQVKFEIASNDATITANDLVRLSGEARIERYQDHQRVTPLITLSKNSQKYPARPPTLSAFGT